MFTVVSTMAGVLALLGAAFLLQTDNSPDTLMRQGLDFFRQRHFTEAQEIFRRLTEARPDLARAWKLLGMAYAAEDRNTLAEPAFTRACALDNKEENACYYLGRTQYQAARFDDAIRSLRVALPYAGASRGRVLLGLALAYEQKSNREEAESFFRQAIEAGEKQARLDYDLFLHRQGGNPGLHEPVPVVFEQVPLPMIVRNGARGEKHLIETMPAGVAVFDYDNDGWPDIFVANGATVPDLRKPDPSWSNRLFKNNHDGTFSDVTERARVGGSGYAMGVAAADFDNDGNVDLFVTGVRSSVLYRNRGDGSFEQITSLGKWSVAAGWFDYDNDGLLDLFVVRYVVWDPAKEIFCGGPGYRQYCNPGQYQPEANALYHNLGQGRFQDVSESSGIAAKRGKGMGVAFGDFDGDGRIDIFVANDTMPNFLFRNEGGGQFRDVALQVGVAYNGDGKPVSAMGADFRDLNNDGLEDLFFTALSNESFPLFRNNGSGHFADITYPSGIGKSSFPWTGWSDGAYDLNNDGWKDLFVAGGHVMDNAELSSGRKSRQPNLVFLNRGRDQFRMQQLAGDALHRGAAFGDFDHDGRIDVVVTRLNESPLVLYNRTPGQNHWIRFQLKGTKSNRDAIGAAVHITSASGQQWNRVTTSVGYGGSSEPVVHFGLGKDDLVDAVEIHWPSGIVQRLANLSANRLWNISELNAQPKL